MSIGFIFWLLMILSVLFGGYTNWPDSRESFPRFGSNLLIWVLFFLLGWKVFGFVIQG